MPTLPKLPKGCSIYRDTNGHKRKRKGNRTAKHWRARLGITITAGPALKRSFATQAAAIEWIRGELRRRKIARPDPKEIKAAGMDAAAIIDAKHARLLLAGRATLSAAAAAWLASQEQAEEKAARTAAPTVADAIEKLRLQKKTEGQSERHCREIKARLTRFFKGQEKKKIDALTLADMEAARDADDTRGLPPSDPQKRKRIRYASILINWAEEKGWISRDANPLRGIARPKERPQEISYLSPQEAAAMLIAARDKAPDYLPALAIKLFSGVRNQELYAMRWEWITAAGIRIPAAHTKTGKARLISILEPLRKWLPTEPAAGLLMAARPEVKDREAVWLDALKTIRKGAKLDGWEQNALRHTFGSYHYAKGRDIGATSKELGNSQAVALKHYAAAAIGGEGCRLYWALSPAVAAVAAVDKNKALADLEAQEAGNLEREAEAARLKAEAAAAKIAEALDRRQENKARRSEREAYAAKKTSARFQKLVKSAAENG